MVEGGDAMRFKEEEVRGGGENEHVAWT